jgi:hypothetical protein
MVRFTAAILDRSLNRGSGKTIGGRGSAVGDGLV